MKLLIGILILLFVLTTISFYDTAYASQACENTFREESYEQDYETVEPATFRNYRGSHYLESREPSHFNSYPNDFSNHQYDTKSWDSSYTDF